MIFPDGTLDNADWLRARRWDLPFKDFDGFIAFNNLGRASRSKVEKAVLKFMQLPSFKVAPEQLAIDFELFVGGTLLKEWDEAEHPRDEKGMFTEAGGDSVSINPETHFEMNPGNADDFVNSVESKVEESLKARGVTGTRSFGGLDSNLKSYVAYSINERLSEVPTSALAQATGINPEYLEEQPDKYISIANYKDDFGIVELADNGSLSHWPANELLRLYSFSENDGWTKEDVEKSLDEFREKAPSSQFALYGTPEAEEIVRNAAVSSLIGSWATSSNDNNVASLAMQEIAGKEFDMNGHHGWAGSSDQTNRDVESYLKDNRETLSAFLHAQYDATQEFLQKRNIETLTVYRGMRNIPMDEVEKLDGSEVSADFRPLTSWSLEPETASGFAGAENGVMMREVVDAKSVFSLPETGFGCLNEHEVVMLGGTRTVEAIGTTKYRENIKYIQDGWTGEDVPLGATVVTKKRIVLTPDATLENSDWMKYGAWDLPFTDFDGFVTFKGLEASPRSEIVAEIKRFQKLPVFESAPESLRTDFELFIGGLLLKEWDEDLHPRDEAGRFTDAGGYTGASSFIPPTRDKGVEKLIALRNEQQKLSASFSGVTEEQIARLREIRLEIAAAPQALVNRADIVRYHQYGLDSLAETAKEELNMSLEEVETTVQASFQKFVDENPVAIQIPFSKLGSVLDDGAKSFYETGSRGGSRGSFYKEIRASAEEAFFGYNENTPADQRPVYGYIMRPEGTTWYDGSPRPNVDSVGHYGNTTVILKDSVKEDTTVTGRDSLDMFHAYKDFSPVPATNVTTLALQPNDIYSVASNPESTFANLNTGYVEAQIHGGVEPSDIEKVILPKEPTKALATKLDNMGISYEVKQ